MLRSVKTVGMSVLLSQVLLCHANAAFQPFLGQLDCPDKGPRCVLMIHPKTLGMREYRLQDGRTKAPYQASTYHKNYVKILGRLNGKIIEIYGIEPMPLRPEFNLPGYPRYPDK